MPYLRSSGATINSPGTCYACSCPGHVLHAAKNSWSCSSTLHLEILVIICSIFRKDTIASNSSVHIDGNVVFVDKWFSTEDVPQPQASIKATNLFQCLGHCPNDDTTSYPACSWRWTGIDAFSIKTKAPSWRLRQTALFVFVAHHGQRSFWYLIDHHYWWLFCVEQCRLFDRRACRKCSVAFGGLIWMVGDSERAGWGEEPAYITCTFSSEARGRQNPIPFIEGLGISAKRQGGRRGKEWIQLVIRIHFDETSCFDCCDYLVWQMRLCTYIRPVYSINKLIN